MKLPVGKSKPDGTPPDEAITIELSGKQVTEALAAYTANMVQGESDGPVDVDVQLVTFGKPSRVKCAKVTLWSPPKESI